MRVFPNLQTHLASHINFDLWGIYMNWKRTKFLFNHHHTHIHTKAFDIMSVGTNQLYYNLSGYWKSGTSPC